MIVMPMRYKHGGNVQKNKNAPWMDQERCKCTVVEGQEEVK
jgi:hypothetical protein